MKKFLTFMLAALLCVGLASCSSCSKSKTEPVKVETDVFEELVVAVNTETMKSYPSYSFVEATAKAVVKDSVYEGTVDPATFQMAYNDATTGTSVLATVKDGYVYLEWHDNPWMEDYFTTPFPPIQLSDAVQVLKDSIGYEIVDGTPVTLRHQLFPNEGQARYFIGGLSNSHTVDVYTLGIDSPAGKQ